MLNVQILQDDFRIGNKNSDILEDNKLANCISL